MAIIYNTLDEKQSITVGGQYFEFGPGQIKLIHNEGLAGLMTSTKAYLGFVAVPDVCMEDRSSPESQEALAHAKQQGVQQRIRYLQSLVYNLEVSLRRDLEMADIKADPTIFASKGDLAAYRELAKLQAKAQDADQAKVDEINELRKQINGGSNSPESSPTSNRDKTPAKSAEGNQ